MPWDFWLVRWWVAYLVGVDAGGGARTAEVCGGGELVTAHDRDAQAVRCPSRHHIRPPGAGLLKVAVSVHAAALVLEKHGTHGIEF